MAGLLPVVLALFAVLALVGLTRWLGFSRPAVLAGPEQARALAQSLPGGFRVADVIVARDRRGALLRDAQDRLALVAPIGAHFLVRTAETGWHLAREDGGRLAISGKDFSTIIDLGPDCGTWHALLSRQTGGAA